MNPDTVETLVNIVQDVFATIGFCWAASAAVGRLASHWSDSRQAAALTRSKLRGHYNTATMETATRYYIWPHCTNIDPSHQDELSVAVTAREGLREKVDEFLNETDSKRHLLILADSGTGKTSFLLNYFAQNERRLPWQKKHRIALVYLGAEDSDTQIKSVPNKRNTILFLDALDEDVRAIGSPDRRIRELMELASLFSHVVMTCRSQFFPSDQEIPIDTGIARIGPRSAGEPGYYRFWRLYLSPLTDIEVATYFKKRFSLLKLRARRQALNVAQQIPKLAARPMLLTHIPDIAASGKSVSKVSDLYEQMVNAWCVREWKWCQPDILKNVSARIAICMFAGRDKRAQEALPVEELQKLSQDWSFDLADWQLTGRSLLNRNAAGYIKFAHRSILEYFCATHLAWFPPGNYWLTDMMNLFLSEQGNLIPRGHSCLLIRSEEADFSQHAIAMAITSLTNVGDSVAELVATSVCWSRKHKEVWGLSFTGNITSPKCVDDIPQLGAEAYAVRFADSLPPESVLRNLRQISRRTTLPLDHPAQEEWDNILPTQSRGTAYDNLRVRTILGTTFCTVTVDIANVLCEFTFLVRICDHSQQPP